MKLNFRLADEGLDGIVQAIRAASPNPIIDIHIEDGAVEIISKPTGYMSPRVTMFSHPVRPEFGGIIEPENGPLSPVLGCECPTCMTARVRRGF